MKNIHILPTDKPSRLVKNHTNKLLLTIQYLPLNKEIYCFPQNIYITSDEKIKKGDWCFNPKISKVIKVGHYGHYGYSAKKIILTTDQDLIKDGVQAIDDEFLEWFVKNPSCEEVEVKSESSRKHGMWKPQYYPQVYKIIIPKEESNQTVQEYEQESLEKHSYELELKQETLEVKRNYQKHSLTKTKGYKLWCNIIQRCYNPKNHSYKYYGEKGVIMEDYFKNSYENFINWIKGIANYEKWLNSSELSLDRIDNTLGYVRGNIKFSTKTEQVENQNFRLDNKSGYKGVCYHKLNKKYGATITINKSKVFLGYYDTALEAALVYDNYVLKNNLNRKTNL